MASMASGMRGEGRRVAAYIAAASFAVIALSSLVLDQAVSLSPSAAANGKIEFTPAWIGNCLAQPDRM